MKYFIFFFLFTFGLTANSKDIYDLAFPTPIKLSELARIVYGEILEQNFILEPEIINDETVIMSGLRNLSKKSVELAFSNVLLQKGFRVYKIDGINYIRRYVLPDKIHLFYYLPKYRSPGYIIGLTAVLFKEGAFTSQRAVRSVSEGSGSSSSLGNNKQSASPTSAAGQIDINANLMIFQGTKNEIDLLKTVLEQVDTPVGEVHIKAIIFEVGSTSHDGSAVGLAMSILSGKLGISFGKPSIGESVSVKIDSIEAVYSALSSDARFRVISSPSIRVQSGSHGLISVGSDVPVLGSVSYDSTGHAIQNIKMVSSGVILDLTPTVTESGIDLVVKQQISSFVPTTTGVNTTPTLIKREISTVVGAVHNEIVILGGLDESKLSDNSSGLPFLPSWLFSSGNEKSKSEILLVLQVQKLDKKI